MFCELEKLLYEFICIYFIEVTPTGTFGYKLACITKVERKGKKELAEVTEVEFY